MLDEEWIESLCTWSAKQRRRCDCAAYQMARVAVQAKSLGSPHGRTELTPALCHLAIEEQEPGTLRAVSLGQRFPSGTAAHQ